MSKLTPNEIKKALECCTSENFGCGNCPLNEFGGNCGVVLRNGCNDLINQYEAKIKALTMDNEQLQSDIINAEMNLNHAQAEIDMLEKHSTEMARKHYQDGKVEATRYFAERLKATPIRLRVDYVTEFDKPIVSKMVLFVDDKDIDNIVEEMEAKEDGK